MAGLFDFLGQGSSSGGLLDFLRQNALQQQFGGGLQSDTAQYGLPQYSPQMQAMAQMPAPQMAVAPQFAPQQLAPSTQAATAPAQITMPQPESPGRLSAGLQGFADNLAAGPIGALIGGIGGAVTGQVAPSAKTQMQNLYSSLIQSGVPAPQALAAVQSGSHDIIKSMLEKYSKQDRFRPATAEERTAAGLDNGTKSDTPLYINTATGEPKFGPPQTNVNVSTEKTGQAELAKTGVEAYVAAQNAGRDAQKRVALYDAFEKAAQGFTPGATAEMRLTAKRYLKDAGLIKGEDVPDGEIMQMISRQLGIHAQPKGQGAVSNYERELFAKSLPNMTQSPEGLKMAIDISRRLEKFDQQVAQIYRDSAKANKGLPNYLEVQEKISALGSPLSDGQMAAVSSAGSAPGSAPVPASVPTSNTGWTNIGNGVKIRPK